MQATSLPPTAIRLPPQAHPLLPWARAVGIVGGAVLLAGALVSGLLAATLLLVRPLLAALPDGLVALALGILAWTTAWGLATGATALLAASRLRAGAERQWAWSVTLLAAGLVALVTGGGFFVGGLAAVAAGALALVAALDAPEPQPAANQARQA